jgi:hypothetical protein
MRDAVAGSALHIYCQDEVAGVGCLLVAAGCSLARAHVIEMDALRLVVAHGMPCNAAFCVW